MSDETVHLSTVGRVVRGRWRVLVVLAMVGALLGACAALLVSPGYRASATVLLQGERAQDALVSAPQVATSSVVLDRVAADLGWHVTGKQLRGAVGAQVSDGNVVTITGSAGSPRRAQQLADRAAKEYMAFASVLASDVSGQSPAALQRQRDTLRQQVARTNKLIGDVLTPGTQGATGAGSNIGTQLARLRSALDQAMTKLDEFDASASPTRMTLIEPARMPSGPASPTTAQLIAAGAVLGFVLGVLGHLVATRLDRRVRGEADIASALGAPILGSVDVPDESDQASEATGWPGTRRRLRRLLLGGAEWNAPRVPAAGESRGREVRYRRVLARLRVGSQAPSRVLVLVADDDQTARSAARLLSAVADTDLAPVALAGAGRDGSLMMRQRIDRMGPSMDLPSAATPTTLDIVNVHGSRPTVPESGLISDVLAIVTAGTRTAWELVGITEACVDAGYELSGVLVTYRSRQETPQRPDAKPPPVGETAVNGKVRTGRAP